MAKNVSYQSSQKDGQNSGAQHVASQNNAHKSYNQRSNNFPMIYLNLQTARYGDVQPFDVFNALPGDTVPLHSKHQIRSYTLKSPMLSGVNLHKDYYLVPMKAILPRTWEFIYTNPTQGDDVPDDAYTVTPLIRNVFGFLDFYRAVFDRLIENTSNSSVQLLFQFFINSSIFLESVFSTGSLPACLGSPFYTVFDGDKVIEDYLVPVLKTIPIAFSYEGNNLYTISENPIDLQDISLECQKVTLRKALEMFRDNPDFGIGYLVDSNNTIASVSEYFNGIKQDFYEFLSTYKVNDNPYDYSRLIAYQLICAHYFTNDHIDFIYSAQLWRDSLQSLNLVQGQQLDSFTYPSFEMNGRKVLYDVVSGACINSIFFALSASAEFFDLQPAENFNNMINTFSSLSYIFGFRKSLKYGDYFTGARPQPLAVGDVTAEVSEDGVSAIDITRSISKQRFLNAVNRFGRKFGDYVKGMFDVSTPPVDTDPKFIAHESFDVSGFEVENTASEQFDANSVTTLLKSSNGKFSYEVYVDTPCIIMGVQSYDVSRIYTSAVDRFFYHRDRFDMFNKFMQYIGDQPISAAELSAQHDNEVPIAYTLRYMEYKQAINRASGGFVKNLPSWAFTTDNTDDQNYYDGYDVISPDFIRSSNVEFDRFYTSLTGYSLGNYFHFIVKFTNVRTPSRQMEYAPSIL